MVSQAKLIAEPWDVGQADSYDIGRFPPLWSEWNGKYRDTMRDFWRRRDGLLPELATRFSGSSDLYGGSRRRPDGVGQPRSPSTTASRSPTSSPTTTSTTRPTARTTATAPSDNRSWNCGVEGPTDDPEILALRARQSRALLTTLLLSFGVPLLLGGDELGRTQHGNNNAYCQDNDDDVVRLGERRRATCSAFTTRLIALRRAHPVFRRTPLPRRRWTPRSCAGSRRAARR